MSDTRTIELVRRAGVDTEATELLTLRRMVRIQEEKIAQLEDRIKLASDGKICSKCQRDYSNEDLTPLAKALFELIEGVNEAESYYLGHECL